LARHATACFLTRGDLWISWEEGRDVFQRLLLDEDWALNNGNWQWLSASNFFFQYFRVYGPVSFPKGFGNIGELNEYIRHFLPAVAKLPDKYLLEPWKAPLSVQKEAGCVVGKDYPERMVIHETASKANISKMAQAYKAAKGEDTSPPPQKKQKTGAATSSKKISAYMK